MVERLIGLRCILPLCRVLETNFLNAGQPLLEPERAHHYPSGGFGRMLPPLAGPPSSLLTASHRGWADQRLEERSIPRSHLLAGAARLSQQRKPLSVPASKAGQPRGSRKLRPSGRVLDVAGNSLPPSTFFPLNPCAEAVPRNHPLREERHSDCARTR